MSRSSVAVAVATVVVLLTFVVGVPEPGPPWVLALVILVVGAVVGAAWFEVRRARAIFQSRLAARTAEAAVAQARLEIARDLHDLASHGMGAVTTRAAVALRVDGQDPVKLRRALQEIEDASRAATTELRRMLHALRGGEVPVAPVPGLGELDELVAANSSLRVRLSRSGDLDSVSEGVSLAAYRVVQEALLNAARHAGPTEVNIKLVRSPEGVELEVSDAGPVPGWSRVPGAGVGLLGLRERVAAVGGSISLDRCGPGMSLSARFPDPVRHD